MPSAEQITRHHDDPPPPGADPFVNGPSLPYRIQVVEYDEGWPADFERVAGRIRDALGDRVLELHHIREPWWHEHRLVKYAEPVAYVHIFGPDCAEVRALPDERSETGSKAKRLRSVGPDRSAATNWATRPETQSWSRQARPTTWPTTREIYDRMFRAHGLIP